MLKLSTEISVVRHFRIAIYPLRVFAVLICESCRKRTLHGHARKQKGEKIEMSKRTAVKKQWNAHCLKCDYKMNNEAWITERDKSVTRIGRWFSFVVEIDWEYKSCFIRVKLPHVTKYHKRKWNHSCVPMFST